MSKFRLLCLLIHYGVWNERDHDVFKRLIVTGRHMYKSVCSNKWLVRNLFNRLAEKTERYTFLNFKAEGWCYEQYENGSPFRKTFFRNGQKHGKDLMWYYNGRLMMKLDYLNGVLSKRTSWYNSGLLEVKSEYRNGKLNGIHLTWHENGRLKSKSFHKDGKTEGTITSWHQNGKVESIYRYKNNMRHGKATIWFDNGQLKNKMIFRND